MAQIIKAALTKAGWPEPLAGDSGNGGYLIYAVELPNTDESKALIEAVLEALAHHYKDELARRNLGIDTTVYNPARLTKLYGTWVRKGDSTTNRPHRLAQILSRPEKRISVSLDLLKKLAAMIQTEEKPQAKNVAAGTGRFDVEAYLNSYGREIIKIKPHCVWS